MHVFVQIGINPTQHFNCHFHFEMWGEKTNISSLFSFSIPPYMVFAFKSFFAPKKLQYPNLTLLLGAIKKLILTASLVALHPTSEWQEFRYSLTVCDNSHTPATKPIMARNKVWRASSLLIQKKWSSEVCNETAACSSGTTLNRTGQDRVIVQTAVSQPKEIFVRGR